MQDNFVEYLPYIQYLKSILFFSDSIFGDLLSFIEYGENVNKSSIAIKLQDLLIKEKEEKKLDNNYN